MHVYWVNMLKMENCTYAFVGIGQSHHGCALIGPGISLNVHSLCEPGLGLFM